MTDTAIPEVPSDLETVGANLDRQFRVLLTPCIVTKKFDRCIMVSLGQIEIIDSDGSKKIANVEGAFSRDGLQSLMADLESVPDPVGLPKREEVKTHSPYMWAAVMNDGDHIQQFATSGEETPFATVHLPDVAQFWVIPKDDPDSLPWYGLIRGQGFVRRENLQSAYEPLPLPHPGNTPFEWHYFRNNTIHFIACAGTNERLPPHVKQVIGWRIDERLFEIAIEPDGTFQVFNRVPLDSAEWETDDGQALR